ncbi:MAG: response regulator transcription factor [candidate division NC10 bacterium]|jgi:DNA-binding NarL/FixJ family response regulator|nr:response regulator transcription factor [candidate division NC10 bacterium]
MIKILVADDHAIVRQGLKQILADSPDLVVAGEASTGKETLEKIRHEKWDVVVLDITLPDPNGLVILQHIKNERPGLPVLVLTMHAEDQYAIRVLRAGAAGFLTKESAPEQLITAIQEVARGGKYLSPTLTQKLFSQLGTDILKPRHETLSDREFQIMTMIVSGKSLTQIAKDLGISVKTVSTHRARLLEKMRLKSNAELVQYALRNGLIK